MIKRSFITDETDFNSLCYYSIFCPCLKLAGEFLRGAAVMAALWMIIPGSHPPLNVHVQMRPT